MPRISNPTLDAFVACLGESMEFGQIRIKRIGSGFDLRHEKDRDRPESELAPMPLDQLRALAQYSAQGVFRPLRSAPDLRRGWRTLIHGVEELGLALDFTYPGAIADWHAAQIDSPPVTSFEEFTARQSGMYRIASRLCGDWLANAVEACCGRDVCLKRRLWTASGLNPDSAETKGSIPCLEPCAFFLEFARQVVRMEQEAKPEEAFTHIRIEARIRELQAVMGKPDPRIRTADFSDPSNPRRLRLELAHLKAESAKLSESIRKPPC